MRNVDEQTEMRKTQHLDICLDTDVEGKGITNGFEKYKLEHVALPEIDFASINLATSFLNHSLQAPFLISSMTGGTSRGKSLNLLLAAAAEKKGWALGLGSARIILEKPELIDSFNVRSVAPHVFIVANLGAVQLNYGYSFHDCAKLVEKLDANALVLHVNSMQEIFQDEGDTNFSDLYSKIEKVCSQLEVPVGVKEVGWGISGTVAKRLVECGVSFIDTAGAGGTSWSQVEKQRSSQEVRASAADAFLDWGIPTAECLVDIRSHLGHTPLVASGGMRNGVEAVKAFALGAHLAGFAQPLLTSANQSEEAVMHFMERIELECRAAMFGIGVEETAQLHGHPSLKKNL